MTSKAATLSTQEIVRRFQPDLILSIGTAGGLREKGAQIGDIYYSSGPVCFHDRHYHITGFKEHGIGSYPSLEHAWVEDFARATGCKTGRVSSGDSLYFSEEQARQFQENSGEVKDMEAAAVAFVASIHSTPFLAIKGITDLIDAPERVEEQFVKNYKLVTSKLSSAALELVDLMRLIKKEF